MTSELITSVAMYFFDCEIDKVTIFIAGLVPAIVAPCASWYIVGLTIKINSLQEEMRMIANYDKLTGTMTRGAFLSQCENAYEIAHRTHTRLAILYIDIDDFKKINDTFGHPGGDEVLKMFGDVLNSSLSKNDLSGRIGGEEFALALPHANLSDATQLAEYILTSIKNNVVTYAGQNLGYTASIGLSLYQPSNHVTLEELFKQADHALYQAKEKGKDCVVVYTDTLSLT
ncbi:GGDEF domain-containing protein [Methylosoma difficile]